MSSGRDVRIPQWSPERHSVSADAGTRAELVVTNRTVNAPCHGAMHKKAMTAVGQARREPDADTATNHLRPTLGAGGGVSLTKRHNKREIHFLWVVSEQLQFWCDRCAVQPRPPPPAPPPQNRLVEQAVCSTDRTSLAFWTGPLKCGRGKSSFGATHAGGWVTCKGPYICCVQGWAGEGVEGRSTGASDAMR